MEGIDHDGRLHRLDKGIGMGLLDHKRAFITGGGSGIGAATARRFAAEGAVVAVADIDGDEEPGKLTTLFNNAGGSTLAPIHKYDEAEWARIITPEDIADVVMFLCSDLARFITGQNLVIDGD